MVRLQRLLAWTLTGLGICFWPLLAGCDDNHFRIEGLNQWAQAVSEPGKGDVPCLAPNLEERPKAVIATRRSRWYPLSVHAIEPGITAEVLDSALESLEWALTRWKLQGRPLPLPDATRGGDSGLDIYLHRRTGPCAQAHLEFLATERSFDSGVGFGSVSIPSDTQALGECVVAAFVQTVLLGVDPAESEVWRRATGSYLAATLLGSAEVSSELQEYPSQSWRGWLSESGGALFWQLVERSKQVPAGNYALAMWERARQKSRTPTCLASSPHLWQVIAAELRASGEVFDQAMSSLSVARYFLSSQRDIPPIADVISSQLPSRISLSEQALEPFGSAFLVVRLRDAHRQLPLQCWLTGEPGVLWSLTAVRLDRHNKELSRVTVPVRHDSKAYLRIEPTPQTDAVLFVITNLGRGIPDVSDGHETFQRAANVTLALAR